ncbi:hypothetical protein J3459_017137 [Metarhizium acridum]|nr:hypothetical protein J3459_017137 [Metarhizium acridum]
MCGGRTLLSSAQPPNISFPATATSSPPCLHHQVDVAGIFSPFSSIRHAQVALLNEADPSCHLPLPSCLASTTFVASHPTNACSILSEYHTTQKKLRSKCMGSCIMCW